MRVPILRYETVETRRPGAFARQMAWLHAAGYTAVSFDDLSAALRGMHPWPRRPVVVTIDHGDAEVVRRARPILQRLSFRATVFVAAGQLGRLARRSWHVPDRTLRLADAALLRDVQADGWTCGTHGVAYRRLPQLTPAECRRDLREARARLEDVLGRAVQHLAYPFGASSPLVHALAEDAGYCTGATATPGLVQADHSALALPRLTVPDTDRLPTFVCRVRTGRSPGDALRDVAARVWYGMTGRAGR